MTLSARSAIENGLQDLVGADYVHGSPILQVRPGDETELAAVLSYLNQRNLRVTPVGGGTKTGWGNPISDTAVVLSTTRLTKIVEYQWADLTVTVQAGCTIATLQNTLAEHRQRVSFDPLWPETATVGGVLSTNDSGALRLGFGGLRDLIIGVTLCLPDGTIAKSGGKVVKNVAGYDLPKLATGALGTLGVITQAVFRLHPMPQHTKTLAVVLSTADAITKLVEAVGSARLAPAALQIRMESDGFVGLEILFQGTEAGVTLQKERFQSLVSGAPIQEAQSSAWMARQELWQYPGGCAIAKLSVLPSEIVGASNMLRVAAGDDLQWRLVWYSLGIGWLRIDGEPAKVQVLLGKLRTSVERQDGSLVILRQPSGSSLDAWGEVGTARDLMQAVKKQFDPKGILNSGRFVAGI